METFLIDLSIRTDEKLQRRTPLGRLLYIQMAAAFDANWGAASYCVSALVAQAFPLEQQAADEGDQTAEAWIAEAKRELRAMVDDGLFLVGEVRNERCIAYRHWERFQTWRDKRGAPTCPMTQEIADTRDWSRLASGSREKTIRWAEKYGLTIGGLSSDQVPPIESRAPKSSRSIQSLSQYWGTDQTPTKPSQTEPTARPADYQQRLQDARMGSAATNALHWDAEAVESIGGQDVLLYAIALDIAANHETRWRAKQWAEVRREGILPGSEYVAQARAAFGLSKPPRLKRGVKRYRCECGHEYEAGPRDLECPECRSLEREEVALSA